MPTRVKEVVAMLSLDMTGEDTAKTGGTFLIEKEPDPSALWDRPSDPHSEWGASKVDPATGARQLPERSCTSRWRCGARATPAGWCAPIRTRAAAITRCSRAPACRRCSTGTSPIATTTPISTRIDKMSAAGNAARRDRGRHDGAVSRVGRSQRRRGDATADGRRRATRGWRPSRRITPRRRSSRRGEKWYGEAIESVWLIAD